MGSPMMATKMASIRDVMFIARLSNKVCMVGRKM